MKWVNMTHGVVDLYALHSLAGARFVRGMVLHLGDAALPFGDRLEAAPLSSLWTAVEARPPA